MSNSKRKKDKGRSLYAKMLRNITSDIDGLFSDLHSNKKNISSNTSKGCLAHQDVQQDCPEVTRSTEHHNPACSGSCHSCGPYSDRAVANYPRTQEDVTQKTMETDKPNSVAADTLGKDSCLCSSLGNTNSCRPEDVLSASNTSLTSEGDLLPRCKGGGRGAACLSPADDEHSVDSGHGGTGRSRHGGTGRSRLCTADTTPAAASSLGRTNKMMDNVGGSSSPLRFDLQHFSRTSPVTNIASQGQKVVVEVSPGMDDLRPIGAVERLVKTNSIWLLASMSRAGAVHILQDRDTGNFIVRKSSQPHSLALSVQSKLSGHTSVDHYLIQGTPTGFRLEGSAHCFHSIPSLIAYYIENIDEIPYHLSLPVAIQQARSTRELASLDMLGQDFWSSPLSRKTPLLDSPTMDAAGILHKSHSEPINIQKQPSFRNAPFHYQGMNKPQRHEIVANTPPSHSPGCVLTNPLASQTQMDRYFGAAHDSSLDRSVSFNTPRMAHQHSGAQNISSLSGTPDLSLTSPLSTSVEVVHSTTFTSVSPMATGSSNINSFLYDDNFSPELSPHRTNQSLLAPEPIYSVSKKQKKKVSESPVKEQPRKEVESMPDTTEANAYTPQKSSIHPGENIGMANSASNLVDDFNNAVSTHPKPKVDLAEQRSCTKTPTQYLGVPETTYFTSNLSDKLSDYEDIWRSSCVETDHCKAQHSPISPIQNMPASLIISDPRAVLDACIGQPRHHQMLSMSPSKDSQVEASTTTNSGKRKVLRKTSRDSPVARRLPAERDAVTGGTTDLTALEQARRIAGSTSDEDNATSPTSPYHPRLHLTPVAHVKGIQRAANGGCYQTDDVVITNANSISQRSSISIQTATIATTTTLNKVVAVTNTNSVHINPSQLNHIKFVSSHSVDIVPHSSQSIPQQDMSSVVVTPVSNFTSELLTTVESLPTLMSNDNSTCWLTNTNSFRISESSQDYSAITSKSLEKTNETGKPLGKNSPTKTTSESKSKSRNPIWSQISKLTRLKSSSESSLATVSSPLYAEPVDAVKLRDKHGRPVNIQVRRQSAPSGPHQFVEGDKDSHATCSQKPTLETIFSPDADSGNIDIEGTLGNKFTFDTVDAVGATQKNVERPTIARSISMRTAHEQRSLQRKHSWKDRLNKLKLGTRVLTRNLTPPSALSARKLHTQTSTATDTDDLLNAMAEGTLSPPQPLSPTTPGKFPTLYGGFVLPSRDSVFSESSTVQDLISSAHPELSVRPIAAIHKQLSGSMKVQDIPPPPSEYDNLGIYRASSVGTVYSPPWDNSNASRLLRESPLTLRLHTPSLPSSDQPNHQPANDRLPHHQHAGAPSSPPPPPLPSNPPPATLTQHSSTPPLSLSAVAQKLPPAMDFHERIARWQDFNTTYMCGKELGLQQQTGNVFDVPQTKDKNRKEQKGTSKGGWFKGRDRDGLSPAVTNYDNPGMSIGCDGRNTAHLSLEKHHYLSQSCSTQERHLHVQQQQLLHHQQQLRHDNIEHNTLQDGEGAANSLQPLPPLSPTSPVTADRATSISLTTTNVLPADENHVSNAARIVSSPSHITLNPAHFVSSPAHIASNSTHIASNPAHIASSPTHLSYRLSSHCPDVVNCHSTPLSPISTSPAFFGSLTIPDVPPVDSRDLENQMVGDDDVLFGGTLNLASTELQRQISPIFSPDNKRQADKTPGSKIREYIFKLSNDQQTTFGSTIENFIQCTLDSHEGNPQHVLRNVRQFMTGIKNYLVKHGEGMLEDLIERERSKLGANEILNIDAIIEQSLHVCVLKPLKYHIYQLFVEKYKENKSLNQLSRNIKYARTRSAEDLGVKPGLKVPDSTDMEVIKYYLDLMQHSYSPLQKLQNLLKATSTIYHCVQGKQNQFPSRGPSSLGADDFLPMLIYVIVHCGLVSAEIEADFMWGLLQPSLLTGEGGYYLTTLSSAVLVLKNFQETHDVMPAQSEGQLPALSDMQGFLKIAIPDELHDAINWRTLPVRPNMNTRDVCSLIAHKFKVTNPQDYGLFLLCDGQESQMSDGDCPQIIKADYLAARKRCFFAFKRLDANIAWPRQIEESLITACDTI